MKKINKKIGILTATMLSAVALGIGSLLSPFSASAGDYQNKTMTFDTSFRTRVTTQLSSATEYKGGSISFDLYSSTFKTEKNVADAQKCTFFGDGVYETNISGLITMTNGQVNDAPHVSFSFYEGTDTMGNYLWRAAEGASTAVADKAATSFTYYADGRILEFWGNHDYRNRSMYLRSPERETSATFVGSSADVQAFLNEGYNYKVSWVWGHVNEDKSISTSMSNSEAWYVAYKKPIMSDDNEYEVLFAFKIKNPTEVVAGANSFAGFEMQANLYDTSWTKNATKPDVSVYTDYNKSGSVKNIQMEMDNLAIYDGYNQSTATVNATADFENGWTNYETDKSKLSTACHLNSVGYAQVYDEDRKAWAPFAGTNTTTLGWSAGHSSYMLAQQNTDTVEVGGLKVQSTDGAIAGIEGPSKRTINTRTDYHKVSFKVGTEEVLVKYVFNGGSIKAPEKIGNQYYLWDKVGVSNITEDVVFNGTAIQNASNTSLMLNTSFRTRVTAEISKANEFKGGSIEFDLVSSNLKTQQYIEYSYAGTSRGIYNANLTSTAYDTDSMHLNYASVTFNFFKATDEMRYENWRSGYYKTKTEGADANVAANILWDENQAASFTYYSNGRIAEYVGEFNQYTDRASYERKAGEEGFVGSQEDVQAFLNEGFNYKVSWVWGRVNEDKTITYATDNFTNEAWYVAYRKEIGAPNSEYELLFAFKVKKPDRVQQNEYMIAGFEISADTGANRTTAAVGAFSTHNRNVQMEFDNIAIYDGYDYVSATKKAKTDFEGQYTDLVLEANLQDVKSAPKITANYPYRGDSSVEHWVNKVAQADGLKVQSTNAAMEVIQSPASRTLVENRQYSVTYKCGETTVATQYVRSGKGTSVPEYAIDGVYYDWDLTGVDLSNVQSDIVINGTTTTMRSVHYDLNGGVGVLDSATQTIGQKITLPSETSATKEHYTLAGWKEGNTIYGVGADYIVTSKNVTLSAVWSPVQYTVTFKNGDTVLQSSVVNAYESAVYSQAVPTKENQTFVGWDKPLADITENAVINAVFSDSYNGNATNNVVKVALENTAKNGSQTIGIVRKLPVADTWTMRLDIISEDLSRWSEGVMGKAYLSIGATNPVFDSKNSAEITQYFTKNTTIKVVANKYSWTLYTKAIDQADSEFVAQLSGAITTMRKESYCGFYMLSNVTLAPSVTLDDVRIFAGDQDYVSTMNWGNLSIPANQLTAVGSFVSVYASQTATITQETKNKSFTVTYKDQNDNVVATRYVFSGGNATVPVIEGYTYTATSVENVTANQEVVGTLTANKYSITFAGEGIDFSALENVEYGTKVTLPTKEDNTNRRRIIGWSTYENAPTVEYPAGVEVVLKAGDLTLYPVWETDKITVTYKNHDGSVLYTAQISYGAVPTYGGATPVKEGFMFNGWDKEIKSLHEDTVFTAVFVVPEVKYMAVIENGKGAGYYKQGETVTITANEREGYTFIGWEVVEGNVEIVKTDDAYSFAMGSSNVKIVAKYESQTENSNFLIKMLSSYITMAVCGVIALGGVLFLIFKKKKY